MTSGAPGGGGLSTRSPERIETRDGSTLIVRPITPADKDVLERGFAHLSADSRYERFLALIKQAEALERHCDEMLSRHHRYVRDHLEDMPEIRDWTWPG